MSKPAQSVLYVRLPVWKIWPGGVVYVADFIHKQRPRVRQEILDLALVPAGRRRAVLSERIRAARPDVVAFSWRNMQTFGPHPENDALDVVMSFDHSPSLWKRLKAAWQALGIIWDYAASRLRNFAWLRLARRLTPGARLVVGGTAVSIFGEYVAGKCPPDTVVVVGEGEEAMLSIVDGFAEPAEVAKEIEALNKHYGVGSIWFTDAQFCSTRRSTRHVEAILDEMLARDVNVRWTGYLRLNHLTPEIARKMMDSGLASIDLSFTGTQDIIDSLTLGYDLEQQMAAFRMFRDAGLWRDRKIKLYMPLNAPGETPQTLRATMARIRELYEMFGRDKVLPFIFFIGIQPNTPIEQRLLAEGYLPAGYDPLTLNPFIIKKLLYNPQPLGGVIGKAYLEALERSSKLDDTSGEYIGRATMENLERKLDALHPAPSRQSHGDSLRSRRQFALIPLATPPGTNT